MHYFDQPETKKYVARLARRFPGLHWAQLEKCQLRCFQRQVRKDNIDAGWF